MNCKNLPVVEYDRKWKVLESYIDDIICTVRDDPDKLLQEVNDLHSSSELTPETLNNNRELAFLDMAVHVNEQ